MLDGELDAPSVRRVMVHSDVCPSCRSAWRLGGAAPECKVAAVYAAGLIAGSDCVLGQVLFHGGADGIVAPGANSTKAALT